MKISKRIISLMLSISIPGAMVLNASAEKQMAFDDVKDSEYYCVVTDADGNSVTSETVTLTIK